MQYTYIYIPCTIKESFKFFFTAEVLKKPIPIVLKFNDKGFFMILKNLIFTNENCKIFTNLTSSSAVARCSTTVVAGTYLFKIGLTLLDPAFSVLAIFLKL